MTDPIDPIDQAAAALAGQTWSTAPAVTRLRTDVRSGENFLIAKPGGALPEFIIGGVVIEWGFEVPRPRAGEFHAWLAANEAELAGSAPAGVRYRGTYGVFAQSDMSLGAYRTVWAFDSLADIELLAAEVSAGSSFGRRLGELTAFRDESIGSSRSQQIYHPAASAMRT